MGTRLSLELGKVKTVRKRVAPHLSFTFAGRSWLSNSNFPTAKAAMGQHLPLHLNNLISVRGPTKVVFDSAFSRVPH